MGAISVLPQQPAIPPARKLTQYLDGFADYLCADILYLYFIFMVYRQL